MRPWTVLGLAAALLAPASLAQDLLPGMWEISLEARVESDPGFQPGPMSMNQCLTKDDAHNPAKVLGSIATGGANNCSYTKRDYEGSTLHFEMQCSGALALHTSGEVTFTATSISGVITTSSTIDGKQVEFKSTLSGRRLGDC